MVSFIEPNYQKLFESAPSYLIVVRPDFVIMTVSEEYLKAAKMNRKDIVGKNFFEVFSDNLELPYGKHTRAIRRSFEKV